MNSGPSSAPASGPACSVAARCASVLDVSAFPRHSSTDLPRSSQLLELLRELQTISVGVEHVQKPDLAVQLEDDADVDTVIP
jgi:hypothetical protein